MSNLSFDSSIWAEIWEYLLFRYFNPPLPYFDNLSNRLEAWTVVIGVGAALIGILLAGIAFVVLRRLFGKLPRALIERGATSEETAIPLSELGLGFTFLLRLSLRRPTSSLRRYIRYVGQVDRTYDEVRALEKAKKTVRQPEPDFGCVPIYLVEERREECLKRFSLEGSDGKAIAFLVAVFTVLFFVICRFLPEIMSVIDRLYGFYA